MSVITHYQETMDKRV